MSGDSVLNEIDRFMAAMVSKSADSHGTGAKECEEGDSRGVKWDGNESSRGCSG